MIVEDDPLIAVDLDSILEDAGFEVVGIARDRNAALSLAERLHPDAATMDIELARRTSGLDTAEQLYERFGVRCLFISAQITTAVRERAAGWRPIGFVEKPYLPKWVSGPLAALD